MTTWQLAKRLMEPMQSSKWATLFVIIRIFYTAAYGIYWVQFLQQAVKAIQSGSIESLSSNLLIFTIISVLFYLSQIPEKYFIFRILTDYGLYLDQKYFKKFINANNNSIERLWTWRAQHIFKTWVFAWVNLSLDIMLVHASVVLTIAWSTVYLFFINWQYGLFTTIWLILTLIRIRLFAPTVSKYRQESKEVIVEIDRLFVKRIMSKREILQNDQFNKEIIKDIELNEQRFDIKKYEKLYQSLWFDVGQIFITLVLIRFVLLWGKRVFDWSLALDQFVLIYGIVQLITQNIAKFTNIVRDVWDKVIHMSKLIDTFEEIDPILGFKTGKNFIPQQGNIVTQKLSYWYTDANLIFNNFSLTLQWWKKTALVWPSWWGKSTLIKLIAWYLHPQSWEILVDDQALPTPQNIESWKHVSLQSYYPHIWYLTQEPSVFDGTIWENLTYGMTEIQQDENLEQVIDQVIKLSKCEFIYEFKDSLQTEIGEKWVRLSWWQRQRLAIAKIMLKNPSIILLDEPTSALDSYNEEQVTQALNNLFQGKTVIIIAHRLQTVKNADEILYITKDEEANSSVVIERGTHAQLLELKWEYHTMVELQSWF